MRPPPWDSGFSALTPSTLNLSVFPNPVLVGSVDHVTPEPGGSLLEAFECWQEAADRKACCDYSLHVDIPQWNDNVKDELEVLVQEKGATRFPPTGPCCCLSGPRSLLVFLFQRHCIHPSFGPISQEQ